MTKIVKRRSAAEVKELQAAIFDAYKASELAARGAVALDIVLATGLPAVPQITSSYATAPAVALADATKPTAGELVKVEAAKLQLEIDAKAEAYTWPAKFAAVKAALKEIKALDATLDVKDLP